MIEPETKPQQLSTSELAGRLAAFLRANRRVECCPHCLGAAFGVSDISVAAAVALLSRHHGFRDDQWLCFRCRRTGAVIRAVCTCSESLGFTEQKLSRR